MILDCQCILGVRPEFMKKDSTLNRFAGGMVLVFAGLSLSGVNYCQENYSIGSQTEIAETATPTPVDDGDLVTNTATASPSATPTAAATATSTPEATATIAALNLRARIFKSLADKQQLPGGSAGSAVSDQWNWLGQIAEDDIFEDTDGDAYSDSLEESLGSAVDDAKSVPPLAASRLSNRMRGSDDDMDGLLNLDEVEAGTSSAVSDTDGDGVFDGAEVLSGSDPLRSDNRPLDTDGDGLSDDLERYLGTTPASADSDSDGLRDDLEIALGTNPLRMDSDGDGVADGREFALGSDPLMQDWKLK